MLSRKIIYFQYEIGVLYTKVICIQTLFWRVKFGDKCSLYFLRDVSLIQTLPSSFIAPKKPPWGFFNIRSLCSCAAPLLRFESFYSASLWEYCWIWQILSLIHLGVVLHEGVSISNHVINSLAFHKKTSEKWTHRYLYNRCLHIVSIKWKYFKTLQLIRSFRKSVITEVPRRRGQDIHQVVCSEYLTENNHNMYGVDQATSCGNTVLAYLPKHTLKSVTNVGT